MPEKGMSQRRVNDVEVAAPDRLLHKLKPESLDDVLEVFVRQLDGPVVLRGGVALPLG